MSTLPVIRQIAQQFPSAEVTICYLMPKGGISSTVTNVFTCLRYLSEPFRLQLSGEKYITERPLSVPDTGMQFGIVQKRITAAEAAVIASCDGSYAFNLNPTKSIQVVAPGEWITPVFKGRSETARFPFAPYVPCAAWMVEYWHGERSGAAQFTDKVKAWLVKAISKELAIDLEQHAERIGNIITIIPQDSAFMKTIARYGSNRLGIHVVSADPAQGMLVHIRAEQSNVHIASSVFKVTHGINIVDFPGDIQWQSVELLGLDSGLLMDREEGHFTTQVDLSLGMMANTEDQTFKVAVPGKSGPDSEIEIRARHGTLSTTTLGGRNEWEIELQQADRKRRLAGLEASQTLFVYSGSHAEREKAIADLGGILANANVKCLKIWDPYFGAEDLIRFIYNVFDPVTPIKVLSAMETTPDDRSDLIRCIAGCMRSNLVDWPPYLRNIFNNGIDAVLRKRGEPSAKAKKILHMKQAIDVARTSDGRRPSYSNLECRVGASTFHDRFIIIDGRCWQLGASFNHIGAKTSTIAECQDPARIERIFDDVWKDSRDISAC